MTYRLLVVDDSQTNLKLALSIIERLNIRADGVSNGLDALAALQRQRYDLVLMDIAMPAMDGMETTRAIRAIGFDGLALPIVAVTANSLADERADYLAAGMNDMLPKPLTPANLRAILADYIDLSLAVPDEPTPLSADLPVLSQDALSLLEHQIGREALVAVLGQFVEELAQRRDKLASGDLAVIRRESHTLKSTAATFGALKLAEAAAETETAARLGLPRATELATALPPLVDEALAAFEALLEQSVGGG